MKTDKLFVRTIESILVNQYPFVTATEWAVLNDICTILVLKKGDVFLAQGKPPKQCAFIKEGIVKYSFVSSDGKESILNFGFDTDYVSDCESYQNNLLGTFSVIALTTTELLAVDNRKLDIVCQQHPGLMKLCVKLSQNIVFQQFRRGRLLAGSTPMYRYKMALEFFPDLIKKISLTNVAKYINVSREAVSRVRLEILNGARSAH